MLLVLVDGVHDLVVKLWSCEDCRQIVIDFVSVQRTVHYVALDVYCFSDSAGKEW